MATTDQPGTVPATVAAWCDHHDLIGALLPFDARRTDTVAEFEALDAALQALPETAATFQLGDLETPDGARPVRYRPTGAGVVDTHLHLLGAWPYRETACGQRWLNPHYIHGHPWETPQGDVETRTAVVRDAARLGALRIQDVAPRFGITPTALDSWIDYHDLPWGAWRQDGRRRLATTLRTAAAWTDRDLWGLCTHFPVPADTVETWVHREVPDGWTPPEDPSQYKWFYR